MLLGNKLDLEKERVVKKEIIDEFVKKNNLIYFETSAKSGLNIDSSFYALTEEIFKKGNLNNSN